MTLRHRTHADVSAPIYPATVNTSVTTAIDASGANTKASMLPNARRTETVKHSKDLRCWCCCCTMSTNRQLCISRTLQPRLRARRTTKRRALVYLLRVTSTTLAPPSADSK